MKVKESTKSVREPIEQVQKTIQERTERVAEARTVFESVTAELVDPWGLTMTRLTPVLEQEPPLPQGPRVPPGREAAIPPKP